MGEFELEEAYVRTALSPLAETKDMAVRSEFVRQYLVHDVEWTVTGSAHSLVGTRHNIEDHFAATFNRLGRSRLSAQYRAH
jgi:hypothetical protein